MNNGVVVLDQSKAMIARLQHEIEQRTSADEAADAVSVIVASCIKPANFDETEMRIRLRQMRRLLTHYPVCVIDEITDPFLGIVGEQKFIPGIAELKAFADQKLQHRYNTLKREQSTVEQIESRPVQLSADERQRRTTMASDAITEIQKAAQKMRLRSPKHSDGGVLTEQENAALAKYIASPDTP